MNTLRADDGAVFLVNANVTDTSCDSCGYAKRDHEPRTWHDYRPTIAVLAAYSVAGALTAVGMPPPERRLPDTALT